MEISLRTAFYVGANAIIGAVSIYKTSHPYEWLTGLAVGLLAGHYLAQAEFDLVETNPFRFVRDQAMKRITYLVPGALMTLINAIALTIITQTNDSLTREAAGSASGILAGILGIALSHLFALDDLRLSTDPDVVQRMQVSGAVKSERGPFCFNELIFEKDHRPIQN